MRLIGAVLRPASLTNLLRVLVHTNLATCMFLALLRKHLICCGLCLVSVGKKSVDRKLPDVAVLMH